jgi:hypothetical protein
MRKNVEFAERISKQTRRPMWSQLSCDEALFKAVMMLSPHLIWSPIADFCFLWYVGSPNLPVCSVRICRQNSKLMSNGYVLCALVWNCSIEKRSSGSIEALKDAD